jgi:molybdopterin-guanine dinucleotide biosynthesis protein B
MKVFSVIGTSKSGKTKTIEALIPEFRRRGYTVGSVKDIHFEGFAIDKEGTNTYRHKMAGSQLVTARGIHETDVMFPVRLPLERILTCYDHDFVILEGAYDFFGPGIITAHHEAEIEERMRPGIFAICGQISNRLKDYRGLPVVNAINETSRLADIIGRSVNDWYQYLAANRTALALKRQRGVERLPSKKNHVYRFGDVVIKHFSDAERFEVETQIGNLLEDAALPVPQRLAVNPLALTNIYRFVEAVPIVELVEDASLNQAREIFDKVFGWMQDFYALTLNKTGRQYILGDVHLRNFLYHYDSHQVYGLDFEECCPGRIESDLARFYVFLLYYDPPFTPRKRTLASYWLKLIDECTSLDRAFLQKEIERENAELLIRRQGRNIYGESTDLNPGELLR